MGPAAVETRSYIYITRIYAFTEKKRRTKIRVWRVCILMGVLYIYTRTYSTLKLTVGRGERACRRRAGSYYCTRGNTLLSYVIMFNRHVRRVFLPPKLKTKRKEFVRIYIYIFNDRT